MKDKIENSWEKLQRNKDEIIGNFIIFILNSQSLGFILMEFPKRISLFVQILFLFLNFIFEEIMKKLVEMRNERWVQSCERLDLAFYLPLLQLSFSAISIITSQ